MKIRIHILIIAFVLGAYWSWAQGDGNYLPYEMPGHTAVKYNTYLAKTNPKSPSSIATNGWASKMINSIPLDFHTVKNGAVMQVEKKITTMGIIWLTE